MLRRDELIEELLVPGADEQADAGAMSPRQPRSRSRGAASGGRGDGRRAARRPSRPAGQRRMRRFDAEAQESKEAIAEEAGEPVTGVLDVLPPGPRASAARGARPDRDDVYVSASQIRRCELRAGDEVAGPARPPRRGERHPALVRVERVNGAEPGRGARGRRSTS